MKQLLIVLGAFLVVATICPTQLEAADALPASLAALGPENVDVLSDQETAEIQGGWYLNLDLPLVVFAVNGRGRMGVNLLTLNGGIRPGRPVQIRIGIGR